jgi:hypothetical protein
MFLKLNDSDGFLSKQFFDILLAALSHTQLALWLKFIVLILLKKGALTLSILNF